MALVKEFKEFAMRGNVMDMAVGVIIGAAFGKIIASAVNDILMPPLGMLLGGVDFTKLFVSLSGQSFATIEDAKAANVATLNYGVFIQTIVDFLIVAFAIFLMVKWINSLKKKEEAAPAPPPTPTKEEELLTEIRDLLARR